MAKLFLSGTILNYQMYLSSEWYPCMIKNSSDPKQGISIWRFTRSPLAACRSGGQEDPSPPKAKLEPSLSELIKMEEDSIHTYDRTVESSICHYSSFWQEQGNGEHPYRMPRSPAASPLRHSPIK